MNPLSIIPNSETTIYANLPDPSKLDFRTWSKIVQECDAAKSKKAAFAEISRRYVGVRGMGISNIKTKYYAWKKDGWEALVDIAKLSSTAAARLSRGQKKCCKATKSPAFIDWWLALQESYQRNSGEAYRSFVRTYHSNDGSIPGLGNWRNEWVSIHGSVPPSRCPIDFAVPDGYSARQLQRIKPNSVELTLMRKGLSAAREMLPKVYTTRAGMEVGQMYVFDDMEHDLYVNAPGNREAMRPLEFAVQDVFSAKRFAWLIQPTRRNPETGGKEQLKETEMRFLLAHVLCNVGYNPKGCFLHVEHGTAAIRTELAELLYKASDGVITVERGGIQNQAAHDGAFGAKGKGNSRFKATLESQHSLVHNVLASLPGQSGLNRDNKPEGLHGLQVYNTKLLAKAANLPPDRAELLQLPVISIDQFRAVVSEAYANINNRHEHNLEGWEDAGLVTNEFRLSIASEWEDQRLLLAMDEDDQALRNAIIRKNPTQFARTRKMSPTEVFAQGLEKLIRLPYCFFPEIVGRKAAKEIRLDGDQYLSFKDRRLGPGIHRYCGTIETETREVVMLNAETPYLVYASPADTSALVVCDMDNVFLGLARALNIPCKMDKDAIHRQIGKVRHESDARLGIVRKRNTQKAETMHNMLDHNNAVLRGDPITPEEIFRAEQVTDTTVSDRDLVAITEHVRPDESDEFTAEEISEILT